MTLGHDLRTQANEVGEQASIPCRLSEVAGWLTEDGRHPLCRDDPHEPGPAVD